MQQDHKAWIGSSMEETERDHGKESVGLKGVILTANKESTPLVAPGNSRESNPKAYFTEIFHGGWYWELSEYERVAGQQWWPNEAWIIQLAELLSGEDLDAFTSVSIESARNYDTVKEAILVNFLVNSVSSCLRLRSSQQGTEESYILLLSRYM